MTTLPLPPSSFLLLLLLLTCLENYYCDGIFPLRMPEIRPSRNETYLCTGVEIGSAGRFWLTGFTPVGRPGSLHHIIVAGCSRKPPSTKHNVWNCGAGGNPVLEPGYDSFVVTLYTIHHHTVYIRLARNPSKRFFSPNLDIFSFQM